MADRRGLDEATASGIANSGGSPFVQGVPTRGDRWRRENPNALRTATTKYGCVVKFWGMQVYYGQCRDCSRLVTTRRKRNEGGRWPALCAECRSTAYNAGADASRRRMARLRRQRYAFRDEQYARLGLLPVRQGVGGDEARIRAIERGESSF